MLAGLVGLAAAGCAGCDRDQPRPPSELSASDPTEVVIVPRSPEIPTYPCMEQCHAEREPDPRPRPLREFHSTRAVEHGPVIHWCGDCHSIEDADRYRLLDGRTVAFDEPHRLCGQCHGDKLRDWRLGIHGLQTGGFLGRTSRRTCTACHDPHRPDRFHFETLPPPPHPHAGQ